MQGQRQSVGKPGLLAAGLTLPPTPAPSRAEGLSCCSPLMLTCAPVDTVSPLSLWASQLKTAVSVRPGAEGDREIGTETQEAAEQRPPGRCLGTLHFLAHRREP